ncbi:MAG: hypothetical protein ABEJ87_02520 [Candidatus Nanohalobium sp.]
MKLETLEEVRKRKEEIERKIEEKIGLKKGLTHITFSLLSSRNDNLFMSG